METIHLDDYLTSGILKEDDFRKKVSKINWQQYSNKKVLIKGCTKSPVPIWSYLIITAHLSKHAKTIFFGEPCSLVKVYSDS
tara:strand:+ start:914 stop:1159 length:246 start_codon:yes stop_codon:yes gene_type:complete